MHRLDKRLFCQGVGENRHRRKIEVSERYGYTISEKPYR